MIILGIDPGSRVTGFGVINFSAGQITHVSHGIIALDEKKDLSQRLLVLSNCLQQLCLQYKPQTAVVEKIFLGKNADSAFKLGHARGVVMLELQRANCNIHEYATRLVKKGITGKGSAEKEDVSQTLSRILKIKKIEKLDASDALALAFFQAQRMIAEGQIKRQMNRMKEVQL